MCGRFSETSDPSKISKKFKVPPSKLPPVKPNYNVAPSQPVLSVYVENGQRHADYLTWGLVPSWAKDPSIGNRMINARAETIAEKPSFRGPFKNSRCIVIADGFYEWKREGRLKQPYYIHLASGELFGFAGLRSRWSSPDGSEIHSCTIITTGPNKVMEPIHHRMPVILTDDEIAVWLDSENHDKKQLKSLLKPYTSDPLEAYPVSTFVNSPANNSPKCCSRGTASGSEHK